MKKSQLKEAIKAEIKSVLSEEEEKFQMTYKGDPVHIKVQGFGGNEEGAKDTVLFVNVGGIGKRESKASKNALEKRLGLLDKKVDKIMFTDKDNTSKEIKDISKDDFKIKSVLSEDFNDDNRGLAYIKSDGERDGFESFTQYAGKQDLKNVPDLEAYTEGFTKGVMQKGNKLAQLISTATRGGADAEPLMKMIGLKEGKRGVVVDPDEIMMHINQYQSGNIDGDDLAQAIEEILVAMMSTPLNEDEDEAPAGDKKIEKAAKGADKAKDDYAKLAGKDNSEISKASSIVKEKAKKAKEGDKEALSWLKSNQKVIKAYNDLKK